MLLVRVIAIACDGCKKAGLVFPVPLKAHLEARDAAAKEGWTRRQMRNGYGSFDLCPECTKNPPTIPEPDDCPDSPETLGLRPC